MKISPLHLREFHRELCKRKFSNFVRLAWPTILPHEPFVEGWHIDYIGECLEEVSEWKIRNLLLTIPLRHMKSLLCSVFFPAWMWTKRPGARFLTASYAAELSTGMAVRSRRLIESPWYQAVWGNAFKMTGDQNVKSRYENNQGGARLALSVGGAVTGEGADCLICDDPQNLQDIHSATIRESTTRWWNEVFYPRLNNPETGCRIVIMQRAHDKDLAGHIIDQGGFTHINLPAKAEAPTTITFPRSGKIISRPEGDPLWPQRFPVPILDDMIKKMGSYAAAAQLQQRPVPAGGGIFKREWWKYYKVLPVINNRIQSWDTAFKEREQNDYSVCTTWGEADNGYYLLDLFRDRMEFPELKRQTVTLYNRFTPNQVLIEDKASGQSLIQELQRETMIPLLAVKVDRDKVARAHAVSPTIEAGRVFLPESAPWMDEFLREASFFPNVEHDDQIDSVTQGLNQMISKNSLAPEIFML